MGMFDDIRCKYPLPIEGACELPYQTKDTDAQFLDQYEITEKGELIHQTYTVEDRSKRGLWEKENPGKEVPPELTGFDAFIGCMARNSTGWKTENDFFGKIVFYERIVKGDVNDEDSGWLEWSAKIADGKLISIRLEEFRLTRNERLALDQDSLKRLREAGWEPFYRPQAKEWRWRHIPSGMNYEAIDENILKAAIVPMPGQQQAPSFKDGGDETLPTEEV
jgi:hypothetical protein